jgi:outer membrane protein
MIKKIAVITLVFAFVLSVGLLAKPAVASAQATVAKIGIFDLQRAINNSKKGQAAKSKLTTKYERMQNELKNSETELQRLQKELETQTSMLSAEAKYEKEKTLKRKLRDFQDKYRDYTEEMKKSEMQDTQPIVNEILKAANQIGKEQGFTLILEAQKAGVIYAPDALDITDQVVRLVDTGK